MRLSYIFIILLDFTHLLFSMFMFLDSFLLLISQELNGLFIKSWLRISLLWNGSFWVICCLNHLLEKLLTIKSLRRRYYSLMNNISTLMMMVKRLSQNFRSRIASKLLYFIHISFYLGLLVRCLCSYLKVDFLNHLSTNNRVQLSSWKCSFNHSMIVQRPLLQNTSLRHCLQVLIWHILNKRFKIFPRILRHEI